MLEALMASKRRMDMWIILCCLERGCSGPSKRRREWGGWVVLQGCCRPDLCQSIDKGALLGMGEGLFLLLLRAATPEMAWQTCQGLGFGLVPVFLRADC